MLVSSDYVCRVTQSEYVLILTLSCRLAFLFKMKSRKTKTLLLVSSMFVCSTWLLAVCGSRFLHFSKFKHADKDYENYLEKLKSFASDSKGAKERLEDWLHANGASKLLNEKTASYLCIGILSKERIGSNIDYLL
jgi:hypothetical protein